MAPRKSLRPKYKRVVLKLSGQTLENRDEGLSIDPHIARTVAKRIKGVADLGIETAIVIGAGNIFRGVSGEAHGIDRSRGDYMGMLATVINALALQDALEKLGMQTRVQSAIDMHRVAEPFILRRALRHLEKGRILIFGAGTGNPFFSTDTAAALRASELGADVLLKATKVDGVYTSDPVKNPKARRYRTIQFSEALSKTLKVMDAAAFSLCRENHIPIVVFDFFKTGNLRAVVAGKSVGTLVHE